MKKKTIDTALAKKYDGMMGRCYREKDRSYLNYGGRGIRVTSEWIRDIESFKTWGMSQLVTQDIPYDVFVNNTKGYQLDRINTEGHYTPENCRFSSPQENARNKKQSRKLFMSAEGEEIEV